MMIKTFPLTIRKSLILENLDFLFLLGLIFFLPLYEGPKNIFWGLYVATASIKIYQQKNFHLTKVDYLILLWISLAVFSALVSPFHYKEWKGVWDVVRYSLIGLMIYKSYYSKEQVFLLFKMIVVATLISIFFSFFQDLTVKETFKLMSVGHQNDSAVFLAMVLLISVILLLHSFTNKNSIQSSIGYIFSSLVIFYSLLETQSRASFLAACVALFIITLLFLYKFKSKKIIFILPLLLSCILFASPGVIKKAQISLENNNFLSSREKVWYTDYIVWKRFPIFGIGIQNHTMVKDDFLKSLLGNDTFEKTKQHYYLPLTQPHSLFLGSLLQTGLLGLTFLLLYIFILVRAITKCRPQSDIEYILQYSIISFTSIMLINGLFTSLLNKENAILFFIILGLWAKKFYKGKT